MMPERKLFLAVILPHVKVFGGVKRFFEIGNILIDKGHDFKIFTPDGAGPDWFRFKGPVIRLEELPNHSFDAVFTTEPGFINTLDRAVTTLRIFYAVLQRREIRKVASRRDLTVLANSGRLYEYLGGDRNENLAKAIGGIDTKKFGFQPPRTTDRSNPFIVMAYGRFYRRKKGTQMVVKSCEKLYRQGYNLKLLLFDSPVDEPSREKVERFSCELPFQFFVDHPVNDLPALYHQADVFVSAERNAGWSNTTAEAMACGVPVVATTSGTEDFLLHEQTGLKVWRHPWFIQRAIKRLYHDAQLRNFLASNARKKIEDFAWSKLADTIEQFILERLK